MRVALCIHCAEMSDPHRRKLIELARHACWCCPSGNAECGSVDGVTQDQMREEVFKKAVLEMLGTDGSIN